jgi:hypothetical protein
MNDQTRKWYGIVAAAVVVLAALGFYFAAHKKAVAPSAGTSDIQLATTTGNQPEGEVSIGSVPNTSGIPAPDLNRAYTPPSNLPANVQADSKKAVAAAVKQLKIDPNHLAYWLQLAVYRKGAGDYAGAEEIWVYCTKVWPKDPLSYQNLGDLYGNYLHDYPKAVAYWTKGSELEPKNISVYLSLATVQNVNMHDTAAARATLEAGLKANPGNVDLQRALDALH